MPISLRNLSGINFNITDGTIIALSSNVCIHSGTINASCPAIHSVCPPLTSDYWKNISSTVVAVFIRQYNWDLKNNASAPCTLLWCQQNTVTWRDQILNIRTATECFVRTSKFFESLGKIQRKKSGQSQQYLQLLYCILCCEFFRLLWKAIFKNKQNIHTKNAYT